MASEEAARRLAIVEEVKALGSSKSGWERAIVKVATKYGISVATLCRWMTQASLEPCSVFTLTPPAAETAFILRDDIELFAHSEGKEFRIEVSDYVPQPGESWNVEEWEDRQAILSAPASRESWRTLYALARVLAKRGKATFHGRNGSVDLELGAGQLRCSFDPA